MSGRAESDLIVPMLPACRLPYLILERTRHGKMIWVVRVGKGRRTRLRAPYGSPEFMTAYHAAIAAPTARRGRRNQPDEGTLEWLWRVCPMLWTGLCDPRDLCSCRSKPRRFARAIT